MSSNNDKKKQNKTESKSRKSKSTKSKEFINNQKIEPEIRLRKARVTLIQRKILERIKKTKNTSQKHSDAFGIYA